MKKQAVALRGTPIDLFEVDCNGDLNGDLNGEHLVSSRSHRARGGVES